MPHTLPHRYLLVDLDGTLLDSRGELSARNSRALHRAVDAGMRLVLATGRTHHSLRRVTAPLHLPPFSVIANGGAVAIAVNGAGNAAGPATVRRLRTLHPALWPRIVEALEAEGLAPVVFAHRHPAPPWLHLGPLAGNAHHRTYVTRNARLCRRHRRLADAAIRDVVEVAALGRDAAFQAASARVLARFADTTRCHSMVLSLGGRWGRITEFFAPGTSKWAALGALYPEAHAHPETVVAIGDEANDLEMIRRAGLGIAMGNAIGGLKARADHVTRGHDEDGVALVLEALLEPGGAERLRKRRPGTSPA